VAVAAVTIIILVPAVTEVLAEAQHPIQIQAVQEHQVKEIMVVLEELLLVAEAAQVVPEAQVLHLMWVVPEAQVQHLQSQVLQ
jgi:hypothetical protein